MDSSVMIILPRRYEGITAVIRNLLWQDGIFWNHKLLVLRGQETVIVEENKGPLVSGMLSFRKKTKKYGNGKSFVSH